jgi:predicted RNA-binding protein YlxR (DUF448 family)
MLRREDHEVHKGHVVALEKKTQENGRSFYVDPYRTHKNILWAESRIFLNINLYGS